MKKHILMRTNMFICLIILIGFVAIHQINYKTYKTILEDDIENITKLTSSHIYAEIDNELTKPIFVAQTMANDSFLKDWLHEESANLDDAVFSQKLQEYLSAYQSKYEYDSVYMISASSNIYYYFEGINKTISPENEHDDWYYDFIESGETYKLNIDADEVNYNEMTVFVDCRIEASDGTLLGITGVGVKMSRLQDMLKQHETDYDLEAFLVNGQGMALLHTDSRKIGEYNLFEQEDLRYLQEQILGNRQSMEMHWYPADQLDNCMITRYIDNLDWYLIIRKNTQNIRLFFQSLIQQDIIIVAIILAMLLMLSTIVIRSYDRMMTKLLHTDTLTALPNQQSFSNTYQASSSHSGDILFLFDIDHFKKVNDTKGHLFGNTVLAMVASVARESVGNCGFVARWGGDEFIGLLHSSTGNPDYIFEAMMRGIVEKCRCGDEGVTISIGAVVLQDSTGLEEVLEKADQALYMSKDLGGNCLSYWKELDKGSAD